MEHLNLNANQGLWTVIILICGILQKIKKLITFAACNTAKGSSNISKRAVNKGAKVAVGWTTSVSAGSHKNWLRRYNTALGSGKTVAQAINSANSYTYLPGSGVKNVKYYGDGTIKIRQSYIYRSKR